MIRSSAALCGACIVVFALGLNAVVSFGVPLVPYEVMRPPWPIGPAPSGQGSEIFTVVVPFVWLLYGLLWLVYVAWWLSGILPFVLLARALYRRSKEIEGARHASGPGP